MKTIKPTYTTFSHKIKPIGGGYLMPVNVAAHGTACTLNTRYEQMALPLDILSLAHYPKTVVLMERDM